MTLTLTVTAGGGVPEVDDGAMTRVVEVAEVDTGRLAATTDRVNVNGVEVDCPLSGDTPSQFAPAVARHDTVEVMSTAWFGTD